jgi:hypothetical protein
VGGSTGNSYAALNGVAGGAGALTLLFDFTSLGGTNYFDQYVRDQFGASAGWGAIPGTLTVVPPVTISTASLPAGQVSVPYSQTLVASGGAPPYTWSYDGSLPPGIAISSAGAVSGTPTVSGTFGDCRIVVTDSAGGSASQWLSLTIGNGSSQTTLADPLVPSKEYIRLNNRIIAIENLATALIEQIGQSFACRRAYCAVHRPGHGCDGRDGS